MSARARRAHPGTARLGLESLKPCSIYFLWRSPAAFSASPHFTFAFARRPDTMFDLILSAVLSLGLLGYLLFALLKPERF